MGTRLGCDGPKALIDLEGSPMLVHTLKRFSTLGLTDSAVVVVSPDHEPLFQECLDTHFPDSSIVLCHGGAERQDSVGLGVDATDPDTDIVVIHDAARPFVDAASVQNSIEAARECGAATVAIPTVDTILQGDAEGYMLETPDRRHLWQCQTPQTFRKDIYLNALRTARAAGHLGTDDASLVERSGVRVRLVAGSRHNIKVTTPADLLLAQLYVREGV